MEFNSVCQSWRVSDCPTSPRELLTVMLEEILRNLPPDSLGHAKGYAQYPGGALFASSTVVPPDIGVQEQGEYRGGELEINLALIFGGLNPEILREALNAAQVKAQTQCHCVLKRILGEIDEAL